MIRDCAGFHAWLDDGRDEMLAGSAAAHARACARCSAALELESLLAAPPVASADAEFTEGVMRRVRDAGRAAAAARLVLAEPPMPWWLRAPSEPAAAMALTVAALLAWRGDGVWSFALALAASARAVDWAAVAGAGLPGVIGRMLTASVSGTLTSGALLAVLLPVVCAVSWVLYRGIETLVAGTPAEPAAAPPAWVMRRGAPGVRGS